MGGKKRLTNDEAIYVLKNTAWLGWAEQAEKVSEAVRMAVDALEHNVHDFEKDADCISRQDAIRWVKTECNPYGKPTLDFESGKWVIEHLKQMPSVQPAYTDAEILKIQDMEQAEIEKAFDLGREDEQSEIIHCKDCKYWMPYDWMFSEVWQSKNMDDYPEKEIGCQYCDMNMGANDFCSRSERRTDGSD